MFVPPAPQETRHGPMPPCVHRRCRRGSSAPLLVLLCSRRPCQASSPCLPRSRTDYLDMLLELTAAAPLKYYRVCINTEPALTLHLRPLQRYISSTRPVSCTYFPSTYSYLTLTHLGPSINHPFQLYFVLAFLFTHISPCPFGTNPLLPSTHLTNRP